MSQDSDWDELIDRHLRGELSEPEMERLAEILDSDASARKKLVQHALWDTQLTEVVRNFSGEGGLPPNFRNTAARFVRNRHASAFTFVRSMAAVTVILVGALAASLFFQRPVSEPQIARIVGVSGSLIWTGNGGQINREVTVGTRLPGGTIEGSAPDSWFQLEFNDGSTLMITGNSMVTFSDSGQKELRLKEGNFSARVVPQPAGKPMLIHTESALLEVLGTQFRVETGVSSTTLSVIEGKVRVKRLSDGTAVDVEAKYSLVAAPDTDMAPLREPDSVFQWKSQLDLGSEGTYGKWSPRSNTQVATLRAIPFVPKENQAITLGMLGLSVRAPDSSAVIVLPGSRFIVRGKITSAANVYFGIQMANTGGEFAGKFLAKKPRSDFQDGSEFEAVIHLNEFGIDPSVRDLRDKLPDKPDGLALTGAWSFTIAPPCSNLEITGVELIPPP